MAGTGYWAYLLDQLGIDVIAYDLDPVGNRWHKGQRLWYPVVKMPAVESITGRSDRTLLLSWPPYDSPDGVETLQAYRGDQVICIGESNGGCCGDDNLHVKLASHWTEVASHIPVQWAGINDIITVYERRAMTRVTALKRMNEESADSDGYTTTER